MDHIKVENSAYNGLNLTNPPDLVTISHANITANRGYGLFVNSTRGYVVLEHSAVTHNMADGVKMLVWDHRWAGIGRAGSRDLCAHSDWSAGPRPRSWTGWTCTTSAPTPPPTARPTPSSWWPSSSAPASSTGDQCRYAGYLDTISIYLNTVMVCVSRITGSRGETKLKLIQACRHVEIVITVTVARSCGKKLYTRRGYILTLHFIHLMAGEDDSAFLEVRDGPDTTSRLIKNVPINNFTRPESIVTTGNNMFITFTATKKIKTELFLEITAGIEKAADLNVTNSYVADNNGRGVWLKRMRSNLHVHSSRVMRNNHVAGVHVDRGAGNVNITHRYFHTAHIYFMESTFVLHTFPNNNLFLATSPTTTLTV